MKGSCDRRSQEQFEKRMIHIIEIKYCRDTDPSEQCLRAQKQHEKPVAALLDAGYSSKQVKMRIITLGATGTIYKDTHGTLRELGIDRKHEIDKCCTTLHRHAAQSVMQIMQTKWAQEQAQQHRDKG